MPQTQLPQAVPPIATLLAPLQGGHPWAARALWTSPGPTRKAPPGPRHNAGQHGQCLVPLCRISRMVTLEVVQQVLGVEVGGPAMLAGFPP